MVEDQRPVPLRLGSTTDAIPSGVSLFRDDVHTGEAARHIAAIHPVGYEPTPKRRLDEHQIFLDGGLHQVTDLVAAVFRHVFDRAMTSQDGSTPSQIVITHPQAWSEHRKALLRAATARAGLPDALCTLVSEPVAAVQYYAERTAPPPPGTHVAVLDFGGGTCDVAVLRHAIDGDGGAFTVVAEGGIDPLGGMDFDAHLASWVHRELVAAEREDLHTALQAPTNLPDLLTFREQVILTKHALSTSQSSPIAVRAEGMQWVGVITRSEFDSLIQEDVVRASTLVSDLLTETLGDPSKVHRIYLTGGSSLVPSLHARLEVIAPGRLATLDDPKQVTSLGALLGRARQESPTLRVTTNERADPVQTTASGEAADDPAAKERSALTSAIVGLSPQQAAVMNMLVRCGLAEPDLGSLDIQPLFSGRSPLVDQIRHRAGGTLARASGAVGYGINEGAVDGVLRTCVGGSLPVERLAATGPAPTAPPFALFHEIDSTPNRFLVLTPDVVDEVVQLPDRRLHGLVDLLGDGDVRSFFLVAQKRLRITGQDLESPLVFTFIGDRGDTSLGDC